MKFVRKLLLGEGELEGGSGQFSRFSLCIKDDDPTENPGYAYGAWDAIRSVTHDPTFSANNVGRPNNDRH